MGRVVIVLWIAAIAFGAFWFVYYQEGANRDITIEMKAEGALVASGKVYITKDILARVDERKGRKTASLIIDLKEKKVTFLDHARKQYASTSVELIDKSKCTQADTGTPAADKNVKRLPNGKTIAGYRCHAFEAKAPFGKLVLWYSYELPLGREKLALFNKISRIKNRGMVASLAGGLAGSPGEEHMQYSSMEYFPLPLGVDSGSGRDLPRVEATRISWGKIDASEFEVPDGYTEESFERLIAQQSRKLGG